MKSVCHDACAARLFSIWVEQKDVENDIYHGIKMNAIVSYNVLQICPYCELKTDEQYICNDRITIRKNRKLLHLDQHLLVVIVWVNLAQGRINNIDNLQA